MKKKSLFLSVFLLVGVMVFMTACGGGGGGTSGGGGGNASNINISINPADGIALTQSATLSWSITGDATSATLTTKEVASVQTLSAVAQDDKPRYIVKKEPDGRIKVTHIFYEDDIIKQTESLKANAAEEKAVAQSTIPMSGSMVVNPTKTTTYTITATGPSGNAQSSVTLTVIPHTPDELVLTYNIMPEIWIYNLKGKTMRWENGFVDVHDSTGYARLQESLDEWNRAIAGPVTFRKSSNPNSPIKVFYDAARIDSLYPGRGICGVASHWIANASTGDFRIDRGEVVLHPNNCLDNVYVTLTHEIGHAIGFNKHTNLGGASIMDAPAGYHAKMVPLVRIMINRLYELPVGTALY